MQMWLGLAGFGDAVIAEDCYAVIAKRPVVAAYFFCGFHDRVVNFGGTVKHIVVMGLWDDQCKAVKSLFNV